MADSTSLEKVQRYVFNPHLNSRPEIESYLTSSEVGTAHPYTEKGKKYLLLNEGSKISQIDITDVDPQKFVSHAELSSAEGKVVEYLGKYPDLTSMKDYSVQMLSPGDVVELPITPDIMTWVASDKKDGNYFDYTITINSKVLTYGNRSVSGLTHSGDVGNLLHWAKGFNNLSDKSIMILQVVGFRKRSLRFFVDQLPVVFLVDHNKRIIYMVPCPLDQATVDNATMSGLVVARKEGETLKCCVLPSPATVDGVDTGNLSSKTNAKIASALEQAIVIMDTPVDTADAADVADMANAVDVDVADAVVEVDDAVTEVDVAKPKMLTFIQDDFSGDVSMSSNWLSVRFGLGFTDGQMEDCPILLPHVFGTVKGVSACALGVTDTSCKATKYLKEWTNTVPSVVHVTDKMKDSVVPSCTMSGNCIMVIHPLTNSKTLSEALSDYDSGTQDGRKRFERFVNGICINATCMAGPNAVVVVDILGRLFWYRGVRLMGLISEIPNYCDDVTHFLVDELVDSWSADFKPVWPLTVSKDNKYVYWKGAMVSISDAVATVSKMTLEELSDSTDDIQDLLTQISVILEANEVREIRDQVDKHLTQLINERIKPLRQSLLEAFSATVSADANADADVDVKNMRATLVAETRRCHKLVQRISNALENLVSVKGASSMNQNIQRRQRATAIANNVAKASSMTIEQKVAMLEKYCAEHGLLMANVDRTDLANSLKAVNTSNFNGYIESGAWTQASICMNPRIPTLDTDTLGSLLELTVDKKDHPLYGSSTVALPQGHSGSGLYESMMPFLLVDWVINKCKDPGTVDWPNVANAEEFAMWRIMMRNTFATCTASRDFNISPQSNDLGFLLIHIILSVMENLVDGMGSEPPNPETDWDNTTCQLLRGMYGTLLSLMASTKNILCHAYKFVYKDTTLELLPNDQWWVISRMVHIFPYTCWDPTNLYNNVKKYIVMSVRKRITNDACMKMQKTLSSTKRVQKVKSPEWLAFLRLVVDTIFDVAQKTVEGTDTDFMRTAQRLLTYKPKEVSKGTQMMVDYLKLVEYMDDVASGKKDWKDGFDDVVMISLFSYLKHSGNIEGEKRSLRKNIHASENVAGYIDVYDKIHKDTWASSANDEHSANLIKILEGGTDSAEASVGASAITTVVPTVVTTSDIIARIPGSSQALAIVDSLPSMTCDSLTVLPSNHLVNLMNLVQVEDYDETLRQTIETLLLRWRQADGVDQYVVDKVFQS
jgi:hypothetical protein